MNSQIHDEDRAEAPSIFSEDGTRLLSSIKDELVVQIKQIIKTDQINHVSSIFSSIFVII